MSSQPEQNSVDHRIKISNCPIQRVTVYKKCALVERLVKVTLSQGEQKVIVEGFCENLVQDSIRVSGHGPATIMGASFQTRKEKIDPSVIQKVKDLESQHQQLKNELKTLEQALIRLGVSN